VHACLHELACMYQLLTWLQVQLRRCRGAV